LKTAAGLNPYIPIVFKNLPVTPTKTQCQD
jgi:hypothetical protein